MMHTVSLSLPDFQPSVYLKRISPTLHAGVHTIAQVARAVLDSHVVRIVLISGITGMVVCVYPTIFIGAVAAGFGIAAIGFWVHRYLHDLIQEVSLLSSFFRKYILRQNWYDTILDGKLILGALPLESQNHRTELLAQNVGAVLSMVEPKEFQMQVLNQTPVRNWGNRVVQKVIPIPDCTRVQRSQLLEASQFIHDQNLLGKCVYVHCRAGIGRSAAAVYTYLIRFEGYKTANDAYEFVQSKKRSQVLLSSRQAFAIDNLNAPAPMRQIA